MNLLGAANYDPVGGAVTKVTTSLLAMTALDTSNLRIAFTIPAHGIVHVRMSCCHHGGTTTAQGFLGCLEGATLRGRCVPTANLLGTAIATTRTKWEVAYTLTGLTPGAVNWDAAYGVEIISSAGGIKYGGPNNTTTDDGFGGFNFEIWDPQPLKIALGGGVNVTQLLGTAWLTPGTAGTPDVNVKLLGGTTQTGRDIGASVLLSSGAGTGQLDFTSGVVKANTTQLAGQTVTAAAGVTFPTSVASPTNITAGTITTVTTVTAVTGLTASDVGAIKTKTDFLPSATAGAAGGLFIAGTNAATAITTALTANVTGNITGNLSGSVGSVTGLTASNLDATISSRASATNLATAQTSIDDLPTNAELATALGTADDAVLAQVALVKAKTDLIPASPATAGSIATLQTSVDDLPTNAELATALGTADDAVLAQVALVKSDTAAILIDTAEIGVAGAGLTALGDTRIAHLDADVSSVGGGTAPTVSEIADEVQTRTIAAVTTVGSVTGLTASNLDATISSRASAANLATAQTSINDIPTNSELATALGTADDATLAQIALVKAKTDLIPAAPAAVGDIPTTAQNADKLLGRNLAGGSDGTRTVKDALRSLRNKTSIAGGTLTVTEEDDTTPAWIAAVTTAAGDPLASIDPA